MKLDEFKSSLKENIPPEGLSVYLLSLWHDGKGDWHKAHSLVDSLSGADAAKIHAYLHRKEGDSSNADYWYRKAGKSKPSFNLDKEWESLVSEFI